MKKYRISSLFIVFLFMIVMALSACSAASLPSQNQALAVNSDGIDKELDKEIDNNINVKTEIDTNTAKIDFEFKSIYIDNDKYISENNDVVSSIITKSISEQTDSYNIEAEFPETESVPVNNIINDIIKTEIENFHNEDVNGNSLKSLDIRYNLYKYNDFIIGFSFDSYKASDVGVDVARKTVIFDILGGVQLHTEDIMDGENFINIVSEYTKAELSNSISDFDIFDAQILTAFYPANDSENSVRLYNYTFDDSNLYLFLNLENDFLEVEIPLTAIGDEFVAEKYILSYFDKKTEILPIKETESTSEMETESLIEVSLNNTKLDSNKKYLAITFDDGPEKTNTPFILDALKETNSKATFFVLGHRLEAMNDIVKRIVDEGHALGSHTYNHKQLTKLSNPKLKEQLTLTDDLITEITGQKTTMLRPPYGERNDSIIAAAEEMGMAIIMWDIDPRDWEIKNVETIRKHIVSNASDGAIILLHDIYKWSVEGAALAIDDLIAQGYTFVTVPELIELKGGKMSAGEIYRNGLGVVKK